MLEEKSESEDIYEMPLLDNVRELISREKELMGLQVAEKAEEAAAWEARARALEAQLADGAGEGGGLTEGMWGEGEPGPPDWVTLQRCTPVELGEAFPGGAVQLKGAGLGRHGAGEVARRLRRLPGLRALGLADNDLEDDAAEQVETFLGLPGLASLDLSHNRLGAACGAALCRGLRSLGSLQVLRLEGNLDLSACPNFGRALAGALGRARRQGGAKRLWSLDVTLRDSRYEGCGKYFQAVFEGCPCQGHSKTAPKPKCEFCRRQWNPLPPDDGAPPMNAHRFLATLNSEDGAFPGLRHLGLRHAWLSPRTARALARRLTGAPGLTSLDLQDAFLGSAGAQELAATLNSPGQCLTSLNLTRNGIACAGAAALAEAIALACPGTLTRLNLTLNDVGAAGARALADALPSAARAGGGVLARLDVGHNPVPRAAAERLAAAALGARVCLGGIEDLDVRVELMAPPRWPRGGGGHPLPFQVVPEEVQQLCVAVGGGDGYQQMVSLTVDSSSLEGEKNKNKSAGRGRAPAAAAAAVPGGREGGAEEEEGQGQRFVRARFLAQRATPDAAAGHFRWRFTRRRALQTAVLAEGVGSAGRALPARGLPPKYRGYRRCEAVLAGLRAGDGLQLWLAAADRRGRALPPSLLPEAGSLKAAQLELYAHDGWSHGLLYRDLAAGAAALRRVRRVLSAINRWPVSTGGGGGRRRRRGGGRGVDKAAARKEAGVVPGCAKLERLTVRLASLWEL